MRKFLTLSAAILSLSALPACNTIDGFGEDLGAVGDAFGGMFDGSMRNSQARRAQGPYGGGMPPPSAPPMQQGYGGGGYGGGYGGGGQMGGGGYGGGGNGMGGMPPQFPPYYQQQPRQPAMPYYYNEGY